MPGFCAQTETRDERSIGALGKGLPDQKTGIIDVGGGASTLVDDLLADGFRGETVLDFSESALEVARSRLGAKSALASWIAGDVRARRPKGQSNTSSNATASSLTDFALTLYSGRNLYRSKVYQPIWPSTHCSRLAAGIAPEIRAISLPG
jgi:hypothetical protein